MSNKGTLGTFFFSSFPTHVRRYPRSTYARMADFNRIKPASSENDEKIHRLLRRLKIDLHV